ncbi:MAG: hypothetical protein R3B91_15380 [Planctomycetaceae bacterium]
MIRRFTPRSLMCLFALGLSLASTGVAAADDFLPGLQDGAAQIAPQVEGVPNNGRICRPRPHGTHFGPPTRIYSAFESPTSYGTHPIERCRPEVFNPRGIGVARRSGCERMDYSPYVLSTTESNHEPSYYTRHQLAPCTHPHCNH